VISDALKSNQSLSVSWQEHAFAGHWLRYQPHTRNVLLLNDTSRFICSLSEKGLSPQEITHKLTEKYAISHQVAERDTRQCLNDWQDFLAPTKQATINNACPPQLISTPSSVNTAHYRYCYQFHLAQTGIQIALNDEQLSQELLHVLGHLEDKSQTRQIETTITIEHDANLYVIAVNGKQLHAVAGIDESISTTIHEMVTCCYKDQAVLHAAAVAHKDTALIIAGTQGSGKSTLVAALQSRGYTYLADDICPLIDKQLLPVPMSQALKQGSWQPLEAFRLELTGQSTHQRLGRTVRYLPPITGDTKSWNRTWPVGALIFPTYQADSRLHCVAISSIEALQLTIQSGALLENQVAEFLSWLEATPAYRIQFSDLAQAIEAVTEIAQSITKAPTLHKDKKL